MSQPEVRFATPDDGVTPQEAGRRTCFVVGDLLVRTRFTTPTEVAAEAARPLTPAEREAVVDEVGYWSPQVTSIAVDGATVTRPGASPVRWVALDELTVGQLTVDRDKVAAHRWIARPEDVVLCVAEVDGELLVVDGNSRAVAAHLNGVDRVGAVAEEAGELQRVARGWCRAEGLDTVAQLAERQVEPAEHRRRWVDRCQDWLAANETD